MTLVVRRSALESLEYPFDPRYHVMGDSDLEVRLSVNWQLATVQEPLAHYRLHASNESVKHRAKHLQEVECWLKEMSINSAISSSASWPTANANYVYLKGIHHLLLGNKRMALAEINVLPWGRMKRRLMLIFLLPTALFQLLKN